MLLFVRRDFVAVYKQTILGPLWYLIQPLLTTLTFTFIFGRIADLPTDGLPQFLFYMSGTVVWGYFAACLLKTSETFVSNAHLFGKVYFPRLAVPISVLISSLVTFLIQFAMFLGFTVWFALRGTDITPNWLWIALSPLLVLIMAGLGLGFGVIVSSLTTKYRDLRFLVQFGVHADDVRHAGHLPGLVHPRAVPVDHPAQPDDPHRRSLPLCLPGRRDGERGPAGLQRRLHAGRALRRQHHLQPRRADVHGYGVRKAFTTKCH